MPHPFRFLAEAVEVVDGHRLADKARKAEDLGYSVLVVTDHLLDQLSPVPALATIAAATQRLRVGTFVLNNDLRHPAVLAQDLATLDVLSGGRLEIGIGAGWNRPEYEAIGIPFEPVPTRVDRLAESIAVLKGLFADRAFDFTGSFYRITAMDGRPKPVQRPYPPFFIGAGGRRLLEIAAREADIVGLAPRVAVGQRSDVASCLAPATAEKVAWVREAAGERFASLEFNTYPSLERFIVTDDPLPHAERLVDRLRRRSGLPLTVEEVLDSPHVFIGTVESLVEKIQGLRERFGINSVMVGDIDEAAPIVARLAGT